MRTYSIHHVNAFTDTPFNGNPTTAVLGAETLAYEEMQDIAIEMNNSECSFILPSTEADFRLMFFTCEGHEIKFCGHAAIGALCAIAKEDLFNCSKKNGKFKVVTNAGISEMEVNTNNPSKPVFIIGVPNADLVPSPFTLDEISNSLRIPKDSLDSTKPAMLDQTNRYLFMSSPNIEKLGSFEIDFQQATLFAKANQITIFCIMTNEVFDTQNHLHARAFAPLISVYEDPFTGSMQSGLVAYALENDLLEPELQFVKTEQGHFLGRPGEAKVEIIQRSPLTSRLHAHAHHLFSGSLQL